MTRLSWLIAVVAVGLFASAIAELLRPAASASPEWDAAPPAAERLAGDAGDPIELHRLMPDATNEVGRRVEVAGTVVSVAPGHGIWVRNIRDHVVFVATGGSGLLEGVATGVAVSVTGEIALLPSDERDRTLRAVTESVSARSFLVRDVKVVARTGDVETTTAGQPRDS